MATDRHYTKLNNWLALITLLYVTLACPIASYAASAFPKPRGLVNDFADVIPGLYEQKLAQVTGELLTKTGVPVVVVTMPDIGGEDYNEYANRLYAAWGIGKKGEDRGVLIFVTLKERKMRIETGYGIEGLIPDGLAGDIRDRYIVPYLKQNRFGEGLLSGTLAIAQIIAKDAGVSVSLTGQVPVKRPGKRGSGLSALVLILLFLLILFSMGRRRGGLWPLLLLLFMGRGHGYTGGYRRGGFGGSFGGFGGGFGGFGGFGGGLSGGGGAGGSF